ncbi:hypothetical protein V5O48_014302 [Marasmius crinis-equi]|uniref:Uncharacterized protein n=1 Tax=Marasmius crinis-equi TaxID=585013 RepID=A0ABR3EXQ1_9AGAR
MSINYRKAGSAGVEAREDSLSANGDEMRGDPELEHDSERAEQPTEVCRAIRVHLRAANPAVMRVKFLEPKPDQLLDKGKLIFRLDVVE